MFAGTQPGTTPAPSGGVSAVVVKLSNPAAGVNHTNRIENNVAVQYLIRQSLAQIGLTSLVPAIYAWAPATSSITGGTSSIIDKEDFGWTISELKSGVDLDREFSSLVFRDKEQVLEQIATVLRVIQTTRLPEQVTKYGGLTFDSSGQIVSGEAPLVKGEPMDSYTELKVVQLRNNLQQAAQSPSIQGWKRNGLDARIEKFMTSGGPEKVLADVDREQKCLVHRDFCTYTL